MEQTPRDLIENTIPVLDVTDVRASIRFYCEELDFKCDWTGSADVPQITSVSRDGHAIMRRSLLMPGRVWIGATGLSSISGS